MFSLKSAFFVAVALAGQASCATIRILGQANYDKADPFEFTPNQITARVGDILEFHFGGPGLGVLGGNHSVAQGIFGQPCQPMPGGFFSGYHAINATSKESDMVFQVTVNSTAPIAFYCVLGTHCTRGMHGVVNGAGSQTLQSYRASITKYAPGVAPARVAGGELVANSISNIIPQKQPGAAGSFKASLASAVVAAGLTLLVV